MFAVWPGSKKTCIAVPCPSCLVKDNYSLKPEVCVPLLQEYKCTYHSKVKIYVWQKYTADDLITNLSIIVTHGRVQWGRGQVKHTYLRNCIILQLWQFPWCDCMASCSLTHTPTLHCNSLGYMDVQWNPSTHQCKMHYKCNRVFDPTRHLWLEFVTATMRSLLLHT